MVYPSSWRIVCTRLVLELPAARVARSDSTREASDLCRCPFLPRFPSVRSHLVDAVTFLLYRTRWCGWFRLLVGAGSQRSRVLVAGAVG